MGTNPDGQEEKRYFHINEDNKVEAVELYFASFVDMYFRYNEEENTYKKLAMLAPIKTAIVHESLHLFGYSELEARVCSAELSSAIASNRCDRQQSAKNMAMYMINSDLKKSAAPRGTKFTFTEKEIFEGREFATPRDLIEAITAGKEIKKTIGNMINPGLTINPIKYSIFINVIQKGETMDTLFSEMSCR
jgi:hypothetical protein